MVPSATVPELDGIGIEPEPELKLLELPNVAALSGPVPFGFCTGSQADNPARATASPKTARAFAIRLIGRSIVLRHSPNNSTNFRQFRFISREPLRVARMHSSLCEKGCMESTLFGGTVGAILA